MTRERHPWIQRRRTGTARLACGHMAPVEAVRAGARLVDCQKCKADWWAKHAPAMDPRMVELYRRGTFRGFSLPASPGLAEPEPRPHDFDVRLRLPDEQQPLFDLEVPDGA